MWPKLIELIVKWWKARPRNDLVAAVVGLREAMSDCQKWYEINKGATQVAGSPHSSYQWMRSLYRVAQSIEMLDRTLIIYSPEARKAVREYLYDDWIMAEAMNAVLSTTAEALGTDDYGVDLQDDILSTSFSEALTALDKFIRDTFTIEEIHAARRLKYGPPLG